MHKWKQNIDTCLFFVQDVFGMFFFLSFSFHFFLDSSYVTSRSFPIRIASFFLPGERHDFELGSFFPLSFYDQKCFFYIKLATVWENFWIEDYICPLFPLLSILDR